MKRSVGCWLMSATLLALACSPAAAAEAAEGRPKVKADVQRADAKPTPESFDLNKSEDRARLAELIRENKVAHVHEEKEGTSAIAADLGIWTLVVFLLLLFILSKLAWKPMLEGLQKRETNIRTAVEEARRARDEAQALQGQIQRRLDKAAEEVRGIIEEGRRDAQQMKEEMIAEARAEIQTERDRLRREIETARDHALHELWNQTAELATLISAKAIRRQVGLEDHRRLVDEALAELGPRGQERDREMGGLS